VKNPYNKTNQMHYFLKFIFTIKFYMFRTVPVSIIGSFSLYTGIVIQILLTACEQDQDGTGSVLILLASCNCNMYDTYHCCVNSEKLLIMGRGTVRNM